MLADLGQEVVDLFIYDELRWRINVEYDLRMQWKAGGYLFNGNPRYYKQKAIIFANVHP